MGRGGNRRLAGIGVRGEDLRFSEEGYQVSATRFRLGAAGESRRLLLWSNPTLLRVDSRRSRVGPLKEQGGSRRLASASVGNADTRSSRTPTLSP